MVGSTIGGPAQEEQRRPVVGAHGRDGQGGDAGEVLADQQEDRVGGPDLDVEAGVGEALVRRSQWETSSRPIGSAFGRCGTNSRST
ncbi:hypothetical protein [Streptomyces sp. NPDC059166]|uniref:hypothetical protein n=1 Tax=Streptomyces sp. NPDC059166 TaxID=3346752 RepID=UPI00368E777B